MGTRVLKRKLTVEWCRVAVDYHASCPSGSLFGATTSRVPINGTDRQGRLDLAAGLMELRLLVTSIDCVAHEY
jgi:hypothetical protein